MQGQLNALGLQKEGHGFGLQTPNNFLCMDGSTDGQNKARPIFSPQAVPQPNGALPGVPLRLQPVIGSTGLSLISNVPLLIGKDATFAGGSFQLPAGMACTVPAAEQQIGIWDSTKSLAAALALLNGIGNDSGIYIAQDPNPIFTFSGLISPLTPIVSFWFEGIKTRAAGVIVLPA